MHTQGKKLFDKDLQYYKFCLYGFLKNLRFFEPFLLLFLLEKLNNNYSQAMSLYSIRFIIRAVLEIPSGIIADALGRKGSMLFAYSFYIVSFVAYFFAKNFMFLLVPTVLFGLGDAFRTGTHKAMILDYLRLKGWQNAKTEYYGNTRSWSQAGSAISSIIAAILILFNKNYEVIFLATIVPYVTGFVLLAGYPKNLDKKFTIKSNISKNIIQAFNSSFHSLKMGANLRLLTNTSFYFGFHNAIKDLLQPVIVSAVIVLPIGMNLELNQKSSLAVGVFYFVIYVFSTFASRNAGKINKYFKKPVQTIQLLSLYGIILSAIISVFLILHLPIIAALIFLPFFPILSLQRPSSINYISNNIDEKIMATTLSVESQIGSATAAVFAFLSGILIKNFGIGVGLGILALIAFIIVRFFLFQNHEKNNTRVNQ